MAMIFQPFNEIDIDGMLKTLLRTLLLFGLIILVGYIYKVKTDEI
ncbi:hypothetical protein [Terrilactibacillus laevilacticus]|uniref:Uncharacterized protein n=1 Tax=Terrilactibacillus laevilacticus TaxID=1380157 RepID=A0ABW5PL02_9BACI|nr:hypothetical protein [Terrilactibacillus laevilacticus]